MFNGQQNPKKNTEKQLVGRSEEGHPVIGRRGAHASFSLSYLDRLVTGSRITMHSFTSPNLQKYSFKPSGVEEGQRGGQTQPDMSFPTPPTTTTPPSPSLPLCRPR